MTRSERIHKLANAIKCYRGSYHPQTKKWISAPQPHKRADIIKWLESLRQFKHITGIDQDQIQKDLASIDGFQNFDEFRNWISKL